METDTTELEAWQAARDEALETTLAGVAMKILETYRVLFSAGTVVFVQAESADDAMQRVDVEGQVATAAALESLRPCFTTQQIGGGKAE